MSASGAAAAAAPHEPAGDDQAQRERMRDVLTNAWELMPRSVKSKCLGMMSVQLTSSDRTKQTINILAISGTGTENLVLTHETNLKEIWKGIRSAPRTKEFARENNLEIADVDVSSTDYKRVQSNLVPVHQLPEVKKTNYLKELTTRLRRLVDSLKTELEDAPITNEAIDRLLTGSVFRIRWQEDELSADDWNELVSGIKDFMENPWKVPFTVHSLNSPKEILIRNVFNAFRLLRAPRHWQALQSHCDALVHMEFTSQQQLKEYCMTMERDGFTVRDLDYGDRGVLLNHLNYAFFAHNGTRLADYVAQCAEDNATIHLFRNHAAIIKDAASVKIFWYSTGFCQNCQNCVYDKPCCGICSVRFVERLKLLFEKVDMQVMLFPEP